MAFKHRCGVVATRTRAGRGRVAGCIAAAVALVPAFANSQQLTPPVPPEQPSRAGPIGVGILFGLGLGIGTEVLAFIALDRAPNRLTDRTALSTLGRGALFTSAALGTGLGVVAADALFDSRGGFWAAFVGAGVGAMGSWIWSEFNIRRSGDVFAQIPEAVAPLILTAGAIIANEISVIRRNSSTSRSPATVVQPRLWAPTIGRTPNGSFALMVMGQF